MLKELKEIKPLKSLGQNFLVNKAVLQQIIKAADLRKDDIVLEIGPGTGVLTKELGKKVSKVICVEKDQRMVAMLRSLDLKNIEIIEGDILKACLPKLKYKVVANIPYYLTSAVIRKLLESSNPPFSIILMIQKEVAQRICAKPPDMSLLAVSVQFYAKPRKQLANNLSKALKEDKEKINNLLLSLNIEPSRRAESLSLKDWDNICTKILDCGIIKK
jgi:16S rRNA (adenine1518-N6/adenine1519-N6)-dimethyltransferase